MMIFNKRYVYSILSFLLVVMTFSVYAVDGMNKSTLKENDEYGKTDPYPLLITDTRDIMWMSATKIGMDLGYDSTIQLYCFFNSNLVNPSSDSKNDKKSNTSEFEKYLDTIEPSTIWTIYTQVNANIAGAQYLQRYYKRNKTWKYVNYINKTVIPGCLLYFKSIDEYVRKNSLLSEKLKNSADEIIKCRKRAILSQKNRIGIVDECQ